MEGFIFISNGEINSNRGRDLLPVETLDPMHESFFSRLLKLIFADFELEKRPFDN